jgi:hypothetical protein
MPFMSEPMCERQRAALRELIRQAAVRAQAEVDTETGFRTRNEAAERELQENQTKIQALYDGAAASADRQVEEARQRIAAEFEQDHGAAQLESSRAQLRANHLYKVSKEKIEADFKESRWTITTVFDADKKVAKEQRATTETRADAAAAKILSVHEQARKLMSDWQLADITAVPVSHPLPEDDPSRGMQQCSVSATSRFQELQNLSLPGLLKKYPWFWVLAWLLATGPAFLLGEIWYYWVLASTVLVAGVGVILWSWMKKECRARVQALYQAICQAEADSQKLHPLCREMARTTYRKQRAESKKRNQEALRQAIHTSRKQLRDCAAQRDQSLMEAQDVLARRLEEITGRRRKDLEEIETTYKRQQLDAESVRTDELAQANEGFARLRDESNRRHAQDWTRLAMAWKQALDQFLAVVQDVDRECRRFFPAWNDPSWKNWEPPSTLPRGIRFGELGVKADTIVNGAPQDPHVPRLQMSGLSFPALLPFPQRASVLFKTRDEGRGRAVDTLQAILLRCLTAIPPGKARITICDPVGRGENFSSFMHLADYEELLVSSRIWTEQTHIEQRLADLTAHMEVVLQKYLRNQYQTLEEYNVQAGEVAEPFRILVVANFPVNFSAESARRLVSLANSGARCGIYTFISVDTRQPMPQGFDLKDLEQACLNLDWQDGEFAWRDPDFGVYPLVLDRPPDANFSTRLMQVIGERAKLAGRVEVPFDYVAPPQDQWWTGDSRAGIAVALGRAGATGRQLFQVGQGTAQHALVGGKTGSGKSTLLHALIAQLAQHYSPEEVELYLVDFKKGVEFKTYASHALPHARVVAVESEREFGLSVLQRLDAELKHRGERFREQGVNDLISYRQTAAGRNGAGAVMPRIVLIVDEFQEFFVEDDKIAQEAALLLDRTVRQGRAFGIHVLLGSQTLGGAYSLARSTIDQMAIRIALQCSEADAHLILSKDNSAARLLTRPGEAIYNASGGLLEGNNLFQVVWLSDERRDQVLDRVAELARARHYTPDGPQIVFEGTAPSELHKNALLERLLKAGPPPAAASAAGPALSAWLGEAIAIKDPTAAVFRRQSGANVLMVGQQGDAAFRMMTSSMISLAAQHGSSDQGGPGYFVIAAVPLEPAEDALWAKLPGVLGGLLQPTPLRDLPALMTRLGEEVERRLKSPTAAPPLFLFLHGLQRIRDLRRGDDDFGFSRRGEERQLSPAKHFANILRDGPTVGIFTTLWCDNLNNLNRSLDRQGLREFEMRVLGQMSTADSSNLIDSPVAAKLGMHRALFYTEDQGRLEKFRPYGVPAPDYLDWVKGCLEKRRPVVERV